MVDVSRIIASADASTGWVTSFYIGDNWLLSIYPETAQKEFFANGPGVLNSGQIAPTAEISRTTDGFIVNGRQSWSSGVVHAQWVMFTGLVHDEGHPAHPYSVMVPRENVTIIEDSWNIAGMQGTGSYDVSVDHVFVPKHRANSFIGMLQGAHPGRETHDNPLYHMSVSAVLGYEAMPVMAGALAGAAEAFLEMTRDRITSYTGASVAAKPGAQQRIGRAYGYVMSVDAMLNDAVRFAQNFKHNPMSAKDRLEVRLRASVITKTVCDAVNDIVHGAGGNSFRDSSRLQRVWRDVNVLRTHAGLDIEPASELFGQMKLGLESPGAF